MTLDWTRLLGGLRRFLGSRSGAIAPMFGLLVVPMAVAVGATVDISRSVNSTSNLQDALDATGLAISQLPSSTPAATVQTNAQQWLSANLHDNSLGTPTISVATSTQTVTLTATSTVSTTMGMLVGVSQIPITSHTVVKWGLSHVELALVLDNTGSMSDDNKLSTLKTSANSLVDTLAAQVAGGSDPNALKISVVPFSDAVNVGSQYQTANWITGTMPSAYGTDEFATSLTNRFTLFTGARTAWAGCVESRPAPYDVQDTAPTVATPATLFIPFFAPDEPDNNSAVESSKVKNGKTTYTYYGAFPNNYMSDATTATDWQTRQGNIAKYVVAPISGTSASTGYTYGPNAGCGLQSLLRLSTNTTTVHTEINAMTAVGDTNIPMGLMWGWHTLTPNAPFADGVAYGTVGTMKIVVLLTDGMNTETDPGGGNPNGSFYSGLGYIWQGRLGLTATATAAQRQAAMDARQTLLCNNMKAKGITVYTVQIDTPGTAPAALSSCASTAADFYDVQDVSNLNAAFQAIAGSISHRRVSQ